MSKPPTLTREQFDRVARTFGDIVERDLRGEAARAFIEGQSAGDEAVAASLAGMLEAHESESHSADTGGLEAEAIEAVRAEAMAVDTQLDHAVPETIGPYRVVRFVASGGMSTVYEAEQDEPRRRVAIKVIRLELLTKNSIRRFESEGHLLARLRHDGIAQVLAMGRIETAAGQVPYLVLEFVDGMPITDYGRAHDLDARARLGLLRSVCAAVQYAHDTGILHRDLKPNNILVDAGGKPHILDFGIARPFDDELTHAALTASGLFLGTLAYMSPEQAMQTGTPPDVRIDVYGVGAVGYEMLTGAPPHDIQGLPIHEAIERVVQYEPATLGARDPHLAGDLSAIFGKALSTDRERRYHSVRELDDDLRRYLEHEPVHARPPSAMYHFRKLVRRHRTTFALLALLVLSLITGLTIALAQRRTALDAEDVARRLAEEATADRRSAELHAAWSALETGRVTDAAQLLESAGPDAVGIEWNLLRGRAFGAARVRGVEALQSGFVVISPTAEYAVARDRENRIARLDLKTAVLHPLPTVDAAHSVAAYGPSRYVFCHHGEHRVVLVSQKRLTVFDAREDRVVRTVLPSAPVVTRADADDDLVLWRPEGSPAAALVDLVRGEIVRDPRIEAHMQETEPWIVMRGRYLLSYGEERFHVLDLHDASERHVSRADFGDAPTARIDPTGRYLLLPYQYPEVYDLEDGDVWRLAEDAQSVCLDVVFSGDGKRLAMLQASGRIRLWDVASRRLLHAAIDSRLAITHPGVGMVRRSAGAIGFHASTGGLRTVMRRQIAEWPLRGMSTLFDHASRGTPYPHVYDLDWHPEGRWLASAAWDERVAIWDTWTGESVGVLDLRAVADACPPGRSSELIDPQIVCWSSDGDHLAVQCGLGWTVVWDAWSRHVHFAGPVGARLLGIDPGPVLVIENEDGTARRISLEEARRTYRRFVKPPYRRESPPAWARDHGDGPWATSAWGYTWSGTRIAEGRHPMEGQANSFKVWDLENAPDHWDGRTIGDALCAQLANDGRRLLLGLRDGTIQVFDVDRRRRLMVIQAHRHYIMALGLSPDGKTLASGSGDGWVRLWPLASVGARVLRARIAAEQRARVGPRVALALREASSPAEAREAIATDAEIDPRDRTAALAELLRSLD